MGARKGYGLTVLCLYQANKGWIAMAKLSCKLATPEKKEPQVKASQDQTGGWISLLDSIIWLPINIGRPDPHFVASSLRIQAQNV